MHRWPFLSCAFFLSVCLAFFLCFVGGTTGQKKQRVYGEDKNLLSVPQTQTSNEVDKWKKRSALLQAQVLILQYVSL